MLQDVTTTVYDIQAILKDKIHKDTILMGQSLESDLKALKVWICFNCNAFISMHNTFFLKKEIDDTWKTHFVPA